jgi:hypothetical protein
MVDGSFRWCCVLLVVMTTAAGRWGLSTKHTASHSRHLRKSLVGRLLSHVLVKAAWRTGTATDASASHTDDASGLCLSAPPLSLQPCCLRFSLYMCIYACVLFCTRCSCRLLWLICKNVRIYMSAIVHNSKSQCRHCDVQQFKNPLVNDSPPWCAH